MQSEEIEIEEDTEVSIRIHCFKFNIIIKIVIYEIHKIPTC